MNAILLMLIGGVTAFVMTLYWVRSRDMREKYALVWMAVATALLLCGLFPRVIMGFAERSQLSYPAAVLFIALAIIYVFSLTVSVSLTHQYRRNVRLLQELAILQMRVRRLELALESQTAAAAAPPDSSRSGQSPAGPDVPSGPP